jgi:2-keto-4-pentenoate hydratase
VVRLSAPLPPRSSPYLRNDIEDAVGSIHPALEIAECRFVHDDRFPPLNAILADGSGSGSLVLGEAIIGWRSYDFSAGDAALHVNGTQRREGRIFDAVEHPLAPLIWIANELSRVGVGLPAGIYISTGSLTGMYLAKPGDELTGDLGPLGEVHAFVGE